MEASQTLQRRMPNPTAHEVRVSNRAFACKRAQGQICSLYRRSCRQKSKCLQSGAFCSIKR